MDNMVENGYKCGMCPRRLASKYSLERHIKLKHKSTSPETKKQKLENNNNVPKLDVKQASDNDSDQESDNNSNVDRKQASDSNSDQESDNNSDLDRNNKNIVYANNAGWVETDNKEEIDNSNMESSDNNEDNSENEESNNNEESDSSKEESDNSESEESNCTKELDFKHKLFDVIETCKDMCDKFGNCKNLATFRIHPAPVGMGCANKYIEWMRELFTGIFDYFSQKYTPEAEDYISFGMLHAEHLDKGMWLWMRKYKELNVNKFVDIFCDANIKPVGDLTIWYKHKKIKQGCQTCGHA